MPASSKAQQKFMGLVRAVQKGEVPKSKVSKAIKKVAKDMKAKEVDKYASTKHKGLPDKVDELVPNMSVINKPAYQQMLDREISKNKKIKTALRNPDDKDHKKAKSIMQRIKDRLMKSMKKEIEEKVNLFVEKNVPTDPSKWAYYVSKAKEKYDVYPSAYANAFAVKQYNDAGGGWRKEKKKKKESVKERQLNEATYVKGKMMVILKNSFNQVHSSLVKNVSLSDSMDDNTKARLAMFEKRMSAAREDYVKAVMRASKPFDKELTGV
tara:strand:- start:79 stop:879 length:801 start_codon:yes stop_codon:yes gene_type:complete